MEKPDSTKLPPPTNYIWIQRDHIHPDLIYVARVRAGRKTAHTLVEPEKIALQILAGRDLLEYFWRRLRAYMASDEPHLYADLITRTEKA